MKAAVIGMGAVGMALAQVLRGAHEVLTRDLAYEVAEPVDVLNICFPFQKGFGAAVVDLLRDYEAPLTIIHSTVPVGTTRAIAQDADMPVVNSPVNGQHDVLERALRVFPKAVGGMTGEAARQAADFLSRAGIDCVCFPSPEHTELAKLLCTLRLGLDILFEKQVHEQCVTLGLTPAWVYEAWTQLYNTGYQQLGRPHFSRPVLTHVPGQIGGSCVIPNARMLPGFEPAQRLLEFNETLAYDDELLPAETRTIR